MLEHLERAVKHAARPGGMLAVAHVSRLSRVPQQVRDIVQRVTAAGGRVLCGVSAHDVEKLNKTADAGDFELTLQVASAVRSGHSSYTAVYAVSARLLDRYQLGITPAGSRPDFPGSPESAVSLAVAPAVEPYETRSSLS